MEETKQKKRTGRHGRPPMFNETDMQGRACSNVRILLPTEMHDPVWQVKARVISETGHDAGMPEICAWLIEMGLRYVASHSSDAVKVERDAHAAQSMQ